MWVPAILRSLLEQVVTRQCLRCCRSNYTLAHHLCRHLMCSKPRGTTEWALSTVSTHWKRLRGQKVTGLAGYTPYAETQSASAGPACLSPPRNQTVAYYTVHLDMTLLLTEEKWMGNVWPATFYGPRIFNIKLETNNLLVPFSNNNILVSLNVFQGSNPEDRAPPVVERDGMHIGVCAYLCVLPPYDVVSHQHRDRGK